MNFVNSHERRAQRHTLYSFSMGNTIEVIELIKLTTNLQGRKTDTEVMSQSTKNQKLSSYF